MSESMFAGIEQATPRSSGYVPGQWILAGKYVLEIEKVKKFTTRKGEKTIIIESRAVESSNPDRPIGQRCDIMIMKRWDSFLETVKEFAAAATPCELKEVDEAGMEYMTTDKNPLKGRCVRVEAVNVTTKAGGAFTKSIFQPMEGQLT